MAIQTKTISFVSWGIPLQEDRCANGDQAKIEKAKEVLMSEMPMVDITGAELEEEALLRLISDSMKTNRVDPAFPQTRSSKGKQQDEIAALLADFEFSSDSEASATDADSQVCGSQVEARQETSEPAPNHLSLPRDLARGRQEAKDQKSFQQWKESVLATLQSLTDAHSRNHGHIGANDEVSFLVAKPSNREDASGRVVFLVRWTNPSEREGRRVRLDPQNRIVWSPAVLFGKTVASTCYDPAEYDCLVSACGAKSIRGKDHLRDKLPDTMVRFLQFLKLLVAFANQETLLGKDCVIQVCLFSLPCTFMPIHATKAEAGISVEVLLFPEILTAVSSLRAGRQYLNGMAIKSAAEMCLLQQDARRKPLFNLPPVLA